MSEKPAISYIRFSKPSQATENAIASHRFRCVKAAETLGVNLPEEYIFLERMSGRRNDRPIFEHVCQMIRDQTVSVLIVRQDRQSRDCEMFLKLSKLFESTGVQLFELTKQRLINFSDPDDWADYMKAGINAERESRVNSARQKVQKEWAKHEGKVLGACPKGYRKSKETGGYEPDPGQWEVSLRMVEIFFECNYRTMAAIRQIDHELGIRWTHQGYREWLCSNVLRGELPYDSPSPVRHQALLTEAQAHQLDLIFKERCQPMRRQTQRTYPLSGLMRCGHCGEPLYVQLSTCTKSLRKYLLVSCKRSRNGYGCEAPNTGKKTKVKRSLPYSLVNGAVLNALQERSEAVIRRGLIEYDKVVDTPEIVELKAQIRSLEKLDDPDIAPALQKKNDRLMGLIAEQQKLGQNYLIRVEKLIQYGKDPNFWLLATEQELIVLYLEFVESVTCWIPDKKIVVKLRV